MALSGKTGRESVEPGWKTREAVEIATLNWVSWFNHHRLMEGLGYIPPAEAEANYYRQVTEQPASQS
jgi:transposase InsO family protein